MSSFSRLALTYFASFAAAGFEYTYLPFYFSFLGFSESQIGILFAARLLVFVVSLPLSAALADRLRSPERVLVLCLVGSFLGAVTMLAFRDFGAVLCVLSVQAMFRMPTSQILDVINVRAHQMTGFARMRLWGSLGFGATGAIFGLAVNSVTYETAGHFSGWAYVGMTAIAAFTMLGFKPSYHQAPETKAAEQRSTQWQAIWALSAFSFFHWYALSTFNVYVSLHSKAQQFANAIPGLAMLVAILAEIAGLRLFAHLQRRRLETLWLLLGPAVGPLRWLITAYAPNAFTLIATQLFHVVSYGLWYPSIVSRLTDYASVSQRTFVQGIFAALVFGVGGILSSTLGGVAMQNWGSSVVFVFAATADFVALLLGWGLLKFWAGTPPSSHQEKLQ